MRIFEFFNQSNKSVNRLLSVDSVTRLVCVVVARIIHFEFELVSGVADALQDELKPSIFALLWPV